VLSHPRLNLRVLVREGASERLSSLYPLAKLLHGDATSFDEGRSPDVLDLLTGGHTSDICFSGASLK
jgi:hypothetical protein